MPEHEPDQPPNVEPDAGVAVIVIDVPEFTVVLHVEPQEIPVPEIVPVPVPDFEIESVYVVGVGVGVGGGVPEVVPECVQSVHPTFFPEFDGDCELNDVP